MGANRIGTVHPMNQRDRQKETTRQRIAAVALELFRKFGYPAVSIRQISAQVGFSTGAIWTSWAGKEALFEDVVERDWPDPAAFARFVLQCGSLDQAKRGAALFLQDFAGENHTGPVWRPEITDAVRMDHD